MQITSSLWVHAEDPSEVFVELKYRRNPRGVPDFIRGSELERFADDGNYETVVEAPVRVADRVWLARLDLVTADEPDVGLVLLGEGLYRIFANFHSPLEDFRVVNSRQPVYVWWRARKANESWSSFSVIYPTVDEWIQELALEYDRQVGVEDPGVVALDDGAAFSSIRAPVEGLVDDRVDPVNRRNMPQGYDLGDRDYDARVTVRRVKS